MSAVIYSQLLPKNDPRYIKWKKSLRKRPSVWNKDKTKQNDTRVKKISNTFKRKKIDNFALWRNNAKAIGAILDPTQPFSKSVELAFLVGIILGDGYLGKMARTEVLRITLGTDKPELWHYVAQIVEKVFHKKPSIVKRSQAKCVDVRVYQKNLSKRLYIPCGAKRKYILEIPQWIQKKDLYIKSCLKGLFEAEGSLSIHLPTSTYNLSFSNINIGLLNEVQESLKRLGFHPERRINAVRLRRKDEVFSFKELINFRQYP